MVKKVIVTLVCQDREYDVEFPADVQLEQMRKSVALALECKGLHLPEGFRFWSNGKQLDETDTLLEAGVWDGSYLEVV